MPPPFADDGKRFPFSPALRQAFSAADASHRASLIVLRDAICDYVEHLRDRGASSEDIVSAIRHRVGELRSSGAVTSDRVLMDGIVDKMVRSCLDPA
jgi:hypothetical protein